MVVSTSLLLTRGRGVAPPELGDLVWLKEVQIGHVATPARGVKGVVVLLAVASEGGERLCTLPYHHPGHGPFFPALQLQG